MIRWLWSAFLDFFVCPWFHHPGEVCWICGALWFDLDKLTATELAFLLTAMKKVSGRTARHARGGRPWNHPGIEKAATEVRPEVQSIAQKEGPDGSQEFHQ